MNTLDLKYINQRSKLFYLMWLSYSDNHYICTQNLISVLILGKRSNFILNNNWFKITRINKSGGH